jgi:hypothetical protein
VTPRFLVKEQSPETLFRAIILFARNVASYKFARAQSLTALAVAGEPLMPLERLAEPVAAR